jgi:hypothetical protein
MILFSSSPIQIRPSLPSSLPSHHPPPPIPPPRSSTPSPASADSNASNGGGESRCDRNVPPPGRERETSSMPRQRERADARAAGEGSESMIRRIFEIVVVDRRWRSCGDVAEHRVRSCINTTAQLPNVCRTETHRYAATRLAVKASDLLSVMGR